MNYQQKAHPIYHRWHMEIYPFPRGYTVTPHLGLLQYTRLLPRIGAGFIVALTGDVMTMPGLPKQPAANNIGIKQGKITGLF